MTFFEAGRRQGGFETGIETALQRLLVSPDFLFRIEVEPERVAPGTPYRLTDVELASRLSFFLWSTGPDDELLDLATRGVLRNPVILNRQVRRLLADPRSSALVKNFAAQWLQLRDLRGVVPDPDLFPEFDENLREAFRQETELFLDSQIRANLGIAELLTADYTFVNERLAKHYQLPGIYGSRFRRVTLDGTSHRGGLLGQGSLLTVTSYPNRTSPVLRGKWLLENILGTPPPPPPPDVPALKDKGVNGERQSVRERLQEHRKNAVCATCHSQMDPLGFALEQFDAVGQYRTLDEARTPIDASGSLPGGAPVRRSARPAVRPAGPPRAVRRHRLGAVAVVRARPRRRILRPPGAAPNRARRRRRRLPLVVHHHRHHREHALSDAESRIMIITKKAIARRTVLRGLGASLALPLLDSMVPAMVAAAQTAAKPVKRLGVVYVPERHGDEAVDAGRRGHGIRVSGDPEAARAVSRPADRPDRPEQHSAGECPQRRRRARPRVDQISHRHPAETVRHVRSLGRHLDGSARGEAARARHPARVARDCHRGTRPRRIVRHRLQLRLHEHHLLARAERRRCRWRTTRGRCSSGCSATAAAPTAGARLRPHAGRQEHSRFGERPHRPSADAHRLDATAPNCPSTSKRSATSSAASRGRRNRAAESCRRSTSRRACRPASRTTPSCCSICRSSPTRPT